MAFNETGSEISKTPESNKLDFDADKLIGSDVKESKSEVKAAEDSEPVDPDKLIESKDASELPSTYQERLTCVPHEPSRHGEWSGKRGDSQFVPSDAGAQKYLVEHGITGIEYKNAIPDFSPVSEARVEIEGMSENRYSGIDGDGNRLVGNFERADTKCAEAWNVEARDGKTDWSSKDVKSWRSENKYSWHENNDMITMDLVPFDIHRACTHLGGVGEIKKLSSGNGGFDD